MSGTPSDGFLSGAGTFGRSVLGSLTNALSGVFGSGTLTDQPPQLHGTPRLASNRELYNVLRTLAYSNGMYRDLANIAFQQGVATRDTRALRNPTNAVNSFYAATLWPGTLPNALDIQLPDGINEARGLAFIGGVHRIWEWSNWGQKKQPFAYWLAGLGTQWLKVASRTNLQNEVDRIFFQSIEPEYVTDWDTDERGFVVWIRLDIPRIRRDNKGDIERYTHIEMWHKDDGTYQVWERPATAMDANDLGRLVIAANIEEFGVDFIPFVQCKCRDDGSQLGVAAVLPALDKIVELDAMATRLHQLLFRHNKADKQLVGVGTDAEGMPLPPPRFDADNGFEHVIGDETFYKLPAGWRIEDIISRLDYGSHLAAMTAHYDALKRTDLSELVWYDVSEVGGHLTGRALDYKLIPAKAKLDEVRGNADTALIRANQMALTMAQNAGVAGYAPDDIGVYAMGDFAHWFADRPFVPPAPTELLENDQLRATLLATFTGAGVSVRGAAEVAGYTPEEQTALEQVDMGVTSPVVPGTPAGGVGSTGS